MSTSHIATQYGRYRAQGMRASEALRAARVWDRFTDLESDGVVRIIREEDEHHHDPDFGPWLIRAEALFGKYWATIDQIGGFEESQLHDAYYLVDLMEAAVHAYEAFERKGA